MNPTRPIVKQDEFRETGFGNQVHDHNPRLMNKNGGSNVRRTGLSFFKATNIYHSLITMKWWKFCVIVVFSYFIVNLLFALLYYFGDLNHVNGMIYHDGVDKFMEVFFFSAQSLTTVGYGRLNPSGLYDSTLATIESLVGLLSFALATGVLYGRFSRPVSSILFSENALIAPYKGITAIMIRLANKNKSELLDPEATLVMSYIVTENGKQVRKFSNLKLELTKVTLLTMSWTLVHPLDEESPLYGWTSNEYRVKSVEFLVMIRAFEETFATTVHSRSSYRFNEIIFGAKFTPMITSDEEGVVIVQLNKINNYVPAPIPETVQLIN